MSAGAPFHPHRDGTLIDILVQPRASKSEISGVHEGMLRIRIAAPPVDGAANDAVKLLLSKRFNVRRNEIQIVSGASSRRKRVLVRGLGVETAKGVLGLS